MQGAEETPRFLNGATRRKGAENLPVFVASRRPSERCRGPRSLTRGRGEGWGGGRAGRRVYSNLHDTSSSLDPYSTPAPPRLWVEFRNLGASEQGSHCMEQGPCTAIKNTRTHTRPYKNNSTRGERKRTKAEGWWVQRAQPQRFYRKCLRRMNRGEGRAPPTFVPAACRTRGPSPGDPSRGQDLKPSCRDQEKPGCEGGLQLTTRILGSAFYLFERRLPPSENKHVPA